ncbi:MAG: hypothetical protein Q9210_000729 [Variospora velana]
MATNGDLPSEDESLSDGQEFDGPDAQDIGELGDEEVLETPKSALKKTSRTEPLPEVVRPKLPEQPEPEDLDVSSLTPLSPEIIARQATINIGTIGHVAHGKSTVVKAISGVQTVRFKNELERNITIKLGYANAKVYKCDNEECPRPGCYRSYKSEKEVDPQCEREGCKGRYRLLRHVSFVDCPGHDILMSTMLSGAAVMDAALLLIAGNETCPQPQTSEHLAAIEIMKLNHIIILQNKVDLMREEGAEAHYQSILNFIRGTVADGSPIIPISAQLKYNIDAINEYLVTKIPVPVRDFGAAPHMIIIRSFDVNKPGAEIEDLKGGVAGGSILTGVLKLGDEIEIRPGLVTKDDQGKIRCRSIFSRVVSLFAEHNDLKFAVPGGLIGVGTRVDPTLCRADRLVGFVLGLKGRLPAIYTELEVNFFLLRRLLGVKTADGKQAKVAKLTKTEVLMVNIGSTATGAKVMGVKADAAKLSLTSPACTEIGEKIALSRRIDKHWRLIGWANIVAVETSNCYGVFVLVLLEEGDYTHEDAFVGGIRLGTAASNLGIRLLRSRLGRVVGNPIAMAKGAGGSWIVRNRRTCTKRLDEQTEEWSSLLFNVTLFITLRVEPTDLFLANAFCILSSSTVSTVPAIPLVANMAGSLPIRFTELLQTLESDHYVCVRQKLSEDANPEVMIVDLKRNNELTRRPIKADSAIMHWERQVIALKANQRTLQIFDLGQKVKLQSATMSEDVVYWKWISLTTLGMVTDNYVYHWKIFDSPNSAPQKLFDRNANLSGCQIINYRVNEDDKWMCAVGISQQQGRVVGALQLYSRDRGISQSIEAHAAAFGTIRLEGAPADTRVFSFAVRNANSARLHVVEIDHQQSNPVFPKKQHDIYFPPEATNDFPVAMQISQKYSVIYLVTKYGFIHLYDLESARCIYMNRISSETIFTTTADSDSAGIVGVNRKGQVLSVTIDDQTVIPYLLANPEFSDLALKLASRAGLPGADNLYQQQFEQLCAQGNYAEAAKLAANSPRGFLRTPQTIERFKAAPQGPAGQLSFILQYFGMLLDKGTLNRIESVELVRPVLQQNRKHLLEKWLKENKLECSEELGDLARIHDVQLALSIYLRANVPQKVVAGFAETGQFEKILPYAKQSGYQPDFAQLLQHIVRVNPEKGAEFATALANDENGPLVDIERVVDVFQSQNMIQQATAFLLDALKDNKPEQGHLQTRLLEMNLVNAPQVADAILGNNMFSYYDKARISQLCENAQLYQRALENSEDPATIKRNVVRTDRLNPDWLVGYFGRMSLEQSLDCLNEMLKVNIRQNLQAVVQIATKYSDLLGPTRLVDLFEKYRTAEGLYYYLGSIVNLSEDPEVHFKYIEAATKMSQFTEVERICRESNYYNPEKVKNFLKEAKLTEQLPLIIVCDRFNLIHDLVLYLYQNQQFKSIEVYVQRVNPARTPFVVGGLLDVDCDELIIKNLLQSVDPASIPIDDLVSEVESRNRLKILLPFLEATLASGNQQQAVYNALAKIYIDSNNNPEKFLKDNDMYDPLTVGKYCEKRDPNLAYTAYRKGQNDLELINITNENGMYKAQARYLLGRADTEIWAFVLNGNNIHRRSLIDQVISTAVPESTEPEKVSVTVKAFLDADLPAELIELLEKIILEPSPFSDNGSLQNLLMLTAAKADKGRLMEYIHQLSAYNGEEIANMCISVGLFEEAFEIYKKEDNHKAAANVLVEHVVSIDRAQEYAERVELPEVWSKVAKAQLDGLRITDGIDSYIRAEDPSNYAEVIDISTHAGKDEDLIKYLRMARKTQREPAIDTALAFCYARTDQLSELEDFLHATNVADVENSGDKAFDQGYHQAAKIFFTSISNWAKLATTLVHLGEYQAAVECARKANSVKVWKQVNEACVDKKEFRLAQICGLNLIVHAEELQDLVRQYERHGYFDELIALLEAGLGLERAHMGMFTELGSALSKYHPDRVMEHLKLFWSRINIPKMIRSCEEAHLWPELIFLYCHYDEWDNAALAMMERASDAWEHHSFKDIVVKVANLEIYYRALNFYLQEQPLLLTDLLQALTARIDVNRVVRMFEKSDNIPLIKPFLLNVQSQNKKTVNNAVNDLLIEEEDYKTLRDSVENYENYDPVDLASRLEPHELVFFRQIAASIYRKNKRWDKSIALSKQDKLFKDAIETAAMSGKNDVVEDLLRYFVDIGSRECYVGMLYACYDLIRLHVVMEVSWRHGLNDFTMPFMINYLSQQASAIETLKKDNEERKAREAKERKEEDNTPILGGSRLMLTQGPGGSASPMANGFAAQPTGYHGF